MGAHPRRGVRPQSLELYPGGVDAALDLVGTPTLPDTLRAVRVHGTFLRSPKEVADVLSTMA
jgi:NADPH:quinone reductase-like Zn-dependent oxidoreductase